MVNKEKLLIDLSDAVNISDLGIKITTALENNNAEDKELHLNLGNIDLKQSQLLSIKALIEAMQSSIGRIDTTSEVTETKTALISSSTMMAENMVSTHISVHSGLQVQQHIQTM